jgi:exopolysaccharide production protein ExoQ
LFHEAKPRCFDSLERKRHVQHGWRMTAFENPRDDIVCSVLAAGVVCSVIAPQGLTWLPALVAVVMLVAWRTDTPGGNMWVLARENGHVLAVLALFLAWVMARSFTAINPSGALRTAGPFVFTLVAVVATLLLTARMGFNGRWLWLYFPILHTALSVAILLFVFNLVDISAYGGQRFSKDWHFNRAALLAALLWPMSFRVVRILAASWQARVLAGAPLLGLTCLAVFSSSSQSAQLALIVMLVVQVLGMLNLKLTMHLIGFGASAAIMVTPLVFGPFYRWFRETPMWHLNELTVTARMRIWRMSLDHVLQSPWIGHGVEFVRETGDLNPATGMLMFHNHPHSFLFQVWVDTGLVGAALLSLLIILVSRVIARIGGETGLLFAVLMVGILTIWAISHGMWQSWFVGLSGVTCIFGALIHQRSLVLADMGFAADS